MLPPINGPSLPRFLRISFLSSSSLASRVPAPLLSCSVANASLPKFDSWPSHHEHQRRMKAAPTSIFSRRTNFQSRVLVSFLLPRLQRENIFENEEFSSLRDGRTSHEKNYRDSSATKSRGKGSVVDFVEPIVRWLKRGEIPERNEPTSNSRRSYIIPCERLSAYSVASFGLKSNLLINTIYQDL